MSEESEVSPPWGALPVEQYLIHNWDPSSPLSAADQTHTLVRAYLAAAHEGSIPASWDATRRSPEPMPRVPTDEEVRTILRPWRPLRWRSAAVQLWLKRYDEAIWLRTHYGEGSDEEFRAWRAEDEDNDPSFDEGDRGWICLDDPEVFDFGDEWGRVFDVMPELADSWAAKNEEELRALRGKLHEQIQKRVAAGEESAEVAAFEAEYGWHGQELQVEAVTSFLLVADARAWETGCLRMLFLDYTGDIVRHTTVPVEHAWDTRNYWLGKKFQDGGWWGFKDDPVGRVGGDPGAELGEKYRAHGEKGGLLYGL